MLFLFGPGSSSVYPQVICDSSVSVLVLLPSGRILSSGSPCPADEWTLLLVCYVFGRFPSALFHQSVSLWGESLHIEQGFADPLHNCLHLQRVIRGIKRTQGSPSSSRLPITDDLMLVIRTFLNLQLPDHCMFWAACTLGYFGFLRSAEFTVPSLATPPARFIWACRISQWTPAQLPRASASLSRRPRQIRSARAAPFILASASIP